MLLLRTGDVCEILSSRKSKMTPKTIDNWTRAGVICPIVPAGGSGRHRVFSAVDILGIALARGMKAQGYPLTAAVNAADVLRRYTEEQLQECFKEGLTCMLILGSQVMPRLVSEGTARDSIDDFEQKNSVDPNPVFLHPTAVDVGQLYRDICRKAEGLRKPRRRSRSKVKAVAK